MKKNETKVLVGKSLLGLTGRMDPSRKSYLAYGMLMTLLSAQARSQGKAKQ
jgi:hypothetical protein